MTDATEAEKLVERVVVTFGALSRAIHGQGDGAPAGPPPELPWFYSIYMEHADAITAIMEPSK